MQRKGIFTRIDARSGQATCSESMPEGLGLYVQTLAKCSAHDTVTCNADPGMLETACDASSGLSSIAHRMRQELPTQLGIEPTRRSGGRRGSARAPLSESEFRTFGRVVPSLPGWGDVRRLTLGHLRRGEDLPPHTDLVPPPAMPCILRSEFHQLTK